VREKTGYPIFSSKIKPSLLKQSDIDEKETNISYSVAFIVREEIPEAKVYNAQKALFVHYEEFAAMHVRAAETTLKKAISNQSIPSHDGAIKYFKEKGVWSEDRDKVQKKMLGKKRGK